MKLSTIFALAVQVSLLAQCDGFSVAPRNTKSIRGIAPLAATTNADFAKGAAASFAIVALTLMSSANVAFAMPTTAFSSSTVTVCDDYTDFSMPSYKSALESPINAKLSGDKFLIAKPAENEQAASTTTR